jgi:hypothetical protein
MPWGGREMPQEFNYDNLNSLLLEEFPFLKERRYAVKIGGFEGWSPGPYVVFGSVFNHYLREMVKSSSEAQRQVGDFLERMATSNDARIEELLTIEVLPTFLESQEILDKCWPCLGEKTRRILWLIAPQKAPSISIPAMMSET